MPGVLQEVDQGSSPTGWHFSGDLNEAQERALHLRGRSGQKNSKHMSQDRSVCVLVQEQHGGHAARAQTEARGGRREMRPER